MYERLKETLNEYEIIIRRWPEYTIVLENVCPEMVLNFLPFFCFISVLIYFLLA